MANDKFEERDLAILRHAKDYGLVLHAVISRLYFSGKQSGHIVRRLGDDGYLELFQRALPGSITYARLNKSGCARLGVSEKYARPVSGHLLSQSVSLVVYCKLGPFRRVRIRHEELKRLFGEGAPHANVPHVLLSKEELSHHAVLRVVFAGGSLLETKKQLRRLIDESLANTTLAEAMRPAASYGFLLLSPTVTHKVALEKALAKSRLLDEALLVLDVGPGVEELPAFLKSLKGAPA